MQLAWCEWVSHARLATVSLLSSGEQWASDANKGSHHLWFCHRRACMVKTGACLCVTSHNRLPGLRDTLVCEWCHSPEYHRVCVEGGGTAVVQWLRCCATNRKVAGSIPEGVIGIFHWHNPSDRTMALGSTQPLTEMSTRSISWGVKAAGA